MESPRAAKRLAGVLAGPPPAATNHRRKSRGWRRPVSSHVSLPTNNLLPRVNLTHHPYMSSHWQVSHHIPATCHPMPRHRPVTQIFRNYIFSLKLFVITELPQIFLKYTKLEFSHLRVREWILSCLLSHFGINFQKYWSIFSWILSFWNKIVIFEITKIPLNFQIFLNYPCIFWNCKVAHVISEITILPLFKIVIFQEILSFSAIIIENSYYALWLRFNLIFHIRKELFYFTVLVFISPFKKNASKKKRPNT